MHKTMDSTLDSLYYSYYPNTYVDIWSMDDGMGNLDVVKNHKIGPFL